MKSGVPWQVSGVRREARETAREAARRAGMSVGEWLDAVIFESTELDDAASRRRAAREFEHDDQQLRSRDEEAYPGRNGYAEEDDGLDPGPGEHRNSSNSNQIHYAARDSQYSADPHDERLHDDRRQQPARAPPPAAIGRGSDELTAELEQRLPLARNEDAPAIHRGFAELHQRLDDLTRQLSQVATMTAAKAARAEPRDEPSRQLAHVLSKLDRRLDQLIAEGRSSRTEIEQRVDAVGRAVAHLQREPAQSTSPPEPAAPLDQALMEIADRQRTLDGYPPVGPATDAMKAAPPPEGLPRARTQDLSGLEQQLRQVNAQIERLKPCGIDRAIDTLRDDLAEIGVMLQDALPRKSVDAIEQEMRKLGERIDHSRNAGADAGALANIERGLAEVRDALRGIAPAENLPGIDRELQQLSQKIDALAHNSQDPAALRQLENAIVSLRGIVSHVASNDALASLSDEVRALAGKVDRATTSSGGDGVLNALEERIAALADALAARNEVGQSVPHELEAVIKGLGDKIERVQLTRADQAALGHLEDRIAKLVEKLDASDARLNHLEAIERGLAELLIHLEHQRVPNLARPASSAAEVDELSRDVADLRNTGKKTQESIELVHGTLGHVVDRLAMIETDMRAKPARSVETPAPVPPVGRAAAPKPNPKSISVSSSSAHDTVRPTVSRAEPSRSAASRGPQPSSPPVEAPQPTEFVLREPATLGESSPRIERHPIDPTLPPDHPLEPGSGESRRAPPGSPADRIAASESALMGAKPPVVSEPSAKSDFIAAARRAAQAAGRAAPAKSAEAKENASPASKLASRVGKLRALIGGTTTILIVLGGMQIAKIFLGSSQGTDVVLPEAQTQAIVAPPERPAEVQTLPEVKRVTPMINDQAPPAASEPPIGRKSSAFTAPGESMFPGPVGNSPLLDIARQTTEPAAAPSTRTAAPAAEREVTGSISPAAKPTGAAPSPGSAPIPTHPATPPSAGDKLPAANLRAAAVKGDAAAQFEIAQRYADGRGVAQNLTEAAEWFGRAAKHGLAPAQFRLGGLYEKGVGVQKNLEMARRLYMAAGEAGNAKALHNLAVLYAEGIDGKPDYQAAARWFRKAADYGVADSQYNLAVLYARGIGVEQNLAEAYRWFALAAREGDADAAKKRDDLAIRLDRNALNAAAQAIEAWAPQQQPAAAVEVKAPPGGWDEATSSPAAPSKRKLPVVGPKLDLATPRVGQ